MAAPNRLVGQTKGCSKCQQSRNAEEPATFVKEFMWANKEKKDKIVCRANNWRKADDANDPAVSSLQSKGQESNTNNDKANKLEPGAGIFLTINLRENIENDLLCRECMDDCDGLGVLNDPPT
eukprot:7728842-Ditylum_brightwellii.AAC.1